MAHRQAAYKNKALFGGDELRRRREEQQVEIRKAKREESVSKRRNLEVASDAPDSDDESVAAAFDSQVGGRVDEPLWSGIWETGKADVSGPALT